jgi:hypothetical protein
VTADDDPGALFTIEGADVVVEALIVEVPEFLVDKGKGFP